MKRHLIFLACLMVSLQAFTQDDIKTGIIYGNNHAFSLTAPDGWILDNKSGVNQGLYAVFYKKGQSWKNAETVMYANTASLENPPHSTLDELIKYDTDNFKKQYQDLDIRDGNNIELSNNKTAKIRYLSGKSYGNFEAIAYIDAGKNGIMIIMSSRSKEGFDNSLTAFQSLVKSYLYIADKVIIE
jgi:hypothetical protein